MDSDFYKVDIDFFLNVNVKLNLDFFEYTVGFVKSAMLVCQKPNVDLSKAHRYLVRSCISGFVRSLMLISRHVSDIKVSPDKFSIWLAPWPLFYQKRNKTK